MNFKNSKSGGNRSHNSKDNKKPTGGRSYGGGRDNQRSSSSGRSYGGGRDRDNQRPTSRKGSPSTSRGPKDFSNRGDRSSKSFKKKNSRGAGASLKPNVEKIIAYIQEKESNTLKIESLFSIFRANHPSKQEKVAKKVSLLVEKEILITDDNKTFTINENKTTPYINQISVVKIKSNLINSHYLVDTKPLSSGIPYETEVIIEHATPERIIGRTAVANMTLDQEKLKAEILFIIDTTQSTYTEEEKENGSYRLITGLVSKVHKNYYITPINYNYKNALPLINHPENINIDSIIKAKINEYSEEPTAEFFETVTESKDSYNLSLLSVYKYDLPYQFSDEALEEANSKESPSLENRTDMRDIPFVTIDGEDAKDFDDAVYVKPLEEDDSFEAYVAIADVSHFVKQGSTLDEEALKRGNSVYLPGAVIPMLPEKLSNDLCSLNPDEDKACIVAKMKINRNGKIESYNFYKALIKSHARLTYSQVQKFLDKEEVEINLDNHEEIINNLFKCFSVLNKDRVKRSALEIETNETQIILNDNNEVADIQTKERYTTHKIIEELMVAANVAAAKFIKKNGLNANCIYRVHDNPSMEKVIEFNKVLKTLNINYAVAEPSNIKTSDFNHVIKKYASVYGNAVHEAVLRSQAQAVYSTNNKGHFGLALTDYAHFTSPIRRYADLMVHRLLSKIINNEEFNYSLEEVNEIAENISKTERIAFQAEMSAKDRLIAQWLETKIGEKFNVVVSSITNAGMFVNINDINASGLVPTRLISTQYVNVNLSNLSINDRKSKKTYKIGTKLTVFLKEADSIKGLLTFSIIPVDYDKK